MGRLMVAIAMGKIGSGKGYFFILYDSSTRSNQRNEEIHRNKQVVQIVGGNEQDIIKKSERRGNGVDENQVYTYSLCYVYLFIVFGKYSTL